MSNSNKHIESYLDYYLGLEKSPYYAILIRGNWGSGKSWFINKYIKDNNINPLFVSLYGISSFREIEEQFFQQLHPTLSSKGMKIASKVLKGILKTSLKIDLDSNGSKDVEINSTVPDIKIPEFLTNLDDKLIVFDDLERCSINIHLILGYINQLVEISGLKVILIANEEEIIRLYEPNQNKEGSKSYLNVKEKLIGKSFDIIPTPIEAITLFINEVANNQLKEILFIKLDEINEIFQSAGYKNLRHLRQSILDFERFFSFLPELVLTKNDLIEHIIRLFFSISIEIKKGTILEDHLIQLFGIDHLARLPDETPTEAQNIRRKYSIFNIGYHPINSKLLTEFFKYGAVDTKEIELTILSSLYFRDENTPDWVKLWYFFELDSSEFQSLYKTVYNELREKKISDPFVLVHVIGMLMRFSDLKLINLSKNWIHRIAIANVKRLSKIGKLKMNYYDEFPSDNYSGLGYIGRELLEFKNFIKEFKKIIELSQGLNYPLQSKVLLDLIDTDVDLFRTKLLSSESYSNIPILVYIPVNKFANKLMKLQNKNKNIIGRIINQRYKQNYNNEVLLIELKWLNELKNIIGIKTKNIRNKLDKINIENGFLISLNQSIEKLTESVK